MFGIGGFELFLILLFGFLIFGPDKLPALAKTVGQAIAKFRDAQAEMTEQLKLDELLKQGGAQEGTGSSAARASRARSSASQESPASVGASSQAKPAPTAGEGASSEGAATPAQPLSFSERKARYEQERAARAQAAKEEAAGAENASTPKRGDA